MIQAVVASLLPGEVVALGTDTATFISQSPHPTYRGLQLVVWKLRDGSFSFDALDPRQVVGTVVEVDRLEQLKSVLTPHVGDLPLNLQKDGQS